MKNVLIASLSQFQNKYEKPTTYFYKMKARSDLFQRAVQNPPLRYDDQGIYFPGFTTNEPAAKLLISELANKAEPERLDTIILLCSKKVQEVVFQDKGSDEGNDENFIRFAAGRKMTEYYSAVIEDFSITFFPELYAEEKIQFIPYLIDDYPDDKQITIRSVQIAEFISEIEGEVTVHIDFNGGMRSIATVFLSIRNLLALARGSEISTGKVISVNYQKQEIEKVWPHTALFETPNMVSAVSDCVRYGRIDTVKQYFENIGKKNLAILNTIQNFMEHLQLCDTEYIMRNKASIHQTLLEYLQNKPTFDENAKTSANVILFWLAMQDVYKTYSVLLTAELPEIIDWCLSHGFIQQALTFCSEHSPQYIMDKKMIVLTDLGQKNFEEAASLDQKHYPSKWKRKYAFYWFNYADYNLKEKEKKEDTLINAVAKNQITTSLNNGDLRKIWSAYQKIKDYRNNTNHGSWWGDKEVSFADVSETIRSLTGKMKSFTEDKPRSEPEQ